MTSPAALAMIIGRAGSKGLPGKNARPLAGRPMICHTIEDALAASTIGRVVVSTDGEAIAEAAQSMGVQVIMRPPALASDTATVDSAVRHGVETLDREHVSPSLQARRPRSGSSTQPSARAPELIVILYANVPIRPDDLIDRAVMTLIETGADSVQSYTGVGKVHPFWLVRIGGDHRVSPYVANTVYRRQELPPLFVPDGGVIAVTRRSLFTVVEDQPHAFLGADRRGIESPPGSVVDVDDEIDLAVAEAMLAKRLEVAHCHGLAR